MWFDIFGSEKFWQAQPNVYSLGWKINICCYLICNFLWAVTKNIVCDPVESLKVRQSQSIKKYFVQIITQLYKIHLKLFLATLSQLVYVDGWCYVTTQFFHSMQISKVE